MKKLHPRYQNEEQTDEELYFSSEDVDLNNREEEIDPRWEALKKLRDN